MKDILILDKQVGETPLQCMDRFRIEHPDYANIKMTYAGRLDPMASGLLLVLAGDAVHDKEKYLSLPKTYECTAIIGIATDTYDILGIPSEALVEVLAPLDKGSCLEALRETEGYGEKLKSFIGTFSQKYPPYSSKTIGGKQMHQIAREGNMDDVEAPERDVTVEDIWDVEFREISRSEISRDIINRIALVTGDFRQSETIHAWEIIGNNDPNSKLTLISFKISVSGGTYIRGIVHELGKKIGKGACIYKLFRTKVGDFTL